MSDATLIYKENVFRPLPPGVKLPGSPNDYRWSRGHWDSIEGCSEVAARILDALQQHGNWAALAVPTLVATWEEEYRDRALHPRAWAHAETLLACYDGHTILGHAVPRLVVVGLLGQDDSTEHKLVWPTRAFVEKLAPHQHA